MIRSRVSFFYHFAIALIGLSILLLISSRSALEPRLGELFLFLALSLTVKRAGFHVAPKVTHSLVGVVDVAAVMIFGAAGAGWVAGLSGLLHIVGVTVRHRNRTWARTVELAAFSFGLKAIMAALGTALYLVLGGCLPLTTITLSDLVPIFALCIAWFALDQVGWGLSQWIEKGRSGALAYSQVFIAAALLVELTPLPLSALLAYQFVTLERTVFVLIAFAVVLVSIAVQRVADLSQAYLRREAELQTLNEFSREVSAARLDEPQILELMAHYGARVADTSNLAISLVDELTHEVDLVIWYRDGQRRPPRHYERWGGLAGWVVEQRRSLLAHDILKEPLPVTGLLLTSQQTRSALFVPLLTKDKVIGVVSLQSHAPNQFTRDHERLFTAIANQASMEIEQARLYRAEQQRARQLETIAEVSQRVAGIFDLDELMNFVAALIKVNFGYYHVDIYLLRGDRLWHRAGTISRSVGGQGLPITETSLVTTVAQQGAPLLVNDVSQEPRYLFDSLAPRTAAELVVPLKSEGRLVGVLEVQSDVVNAFSDADVFVMQTLADQVALAIQEAELFTSIQQEAYISNAVLQVAEAVGSLTDVNEILSTLVRITPLLVGVRRCFVLTWDERDGLLVGGESYGVSAADARRLRESRFAPSVFFAEPDLPTSPAPREIFLPEDLAREAGVATALVIPLLIRGGLLGAFCVDGGADLEARRISLLVGIANQAALAIETAQLENERDLRARLAQELAIGRTIQSSLLPECPPQIEGFELAALWTPALQVAGDFYDFLPLLEGRWGFMIADVADKGVPAAIYMTLARTITRAIGLGRATPRTPHQVLERANEIILSDARTDMFVTAFYAVLDPATRSFCYSIAGHCPPLWLRARDQSVEWLRGRGLPLGVQMNIELPERGLMLESGDVIVLYTDGVTEATNADYELYGDARLQQAVLSAHHLGAQAVMDRIVSDVKEFVGRQEQADDLTMVVLRCV